MPAAAETHAMRVLRMSTRGRAATFGGAALLGHLSQFAWIALGSRTMSSETFGAVLAAQAVYSFLQIVIDNGPGLYGARLAASQRIDAEARGSIVRVRVQLGFICAVAALAVGSAAGARSLEATIPFAVALVLFAALNYWEPYGMGDVRPWSSYVVLRSAAPAGVAFACFALGRSFAPPLAGAAECAVILTIATAFRLSAHRAVRGALTAPRGPWRSVTRIGLPVVIGQLGFACGAVVLNAVGAPRAAAVFAVSIRLVTGINQLTGTLATALFPRLAAQKKDSELDLCGVRMAARALVILSFGASAVLMYRPALVTSLLLAHAGRAAASASILTLATSCATGFVVLFTLVLLARDRENAFLVVYGTATCVILTGAVGVALAPAPSAVAMAYVFGAGQLAGMAVLARHAVLAIPEVATTVRRTAAAGAMLIGLGVVAATVPSARPATAAVAAGCATAVALGRVRRLRRFALAAETATRV
jgi:O-antigen/teichoic acid export membrane protein